MNVVIYARYSSHNQTEQSIEGQIKVCKEYAERNDYKITHIYKDEARSGTSDSREQFQQMIEDSSKKQFQGVLVYQLDRFARNRYDSSNYKHKLKKNGVRVFSAKENISDDASGILMESVLEGMAEYYSVELGQKVKRGMGINAEYCYYNGGQVPLGFKLVEVDSIYTDKMGRPIKKKKYAIDEEIAPYMKQIFEMYANGHLMKEAYEWLNNKGIRTTKGKKFTKSSLRNIYMNKKYKGTYFYDGVEVEDGIPRIVDDDTFYMVQQRLAQNAYAPSRTKAKEEYLLTTKLFCGNCKEMMTGISGTSQNKKLHHYYTCNGKKEHKCNRKNIKKDVIENLVISNARMLLTDDIINEISEAVYKTACKTQDKTRLKQLQREIIKLDNQRANLFDSLKICYDDNVKKSIFEEISKMENQKRELETLIKDEESNIFQIEEKEIRAFFKSLRRGDIKDIRYKKMITNVLVDKVYVYDDHITTTYTIQDENGERVKAHLPAIEELENLFKNEKSSFLDDYAEPSLNNLANLKDLQS